MIGELEEDDRGDEFTLMLENELGASNITVSIKSFKDDEGQLENITYMY